MTHISRETRFGKAKGKVGSLKMSKKDNGESKVKVIRGLQLLSVSNCLVGWMTVPVGCHVVIYVFDVLAKKLTANVSYVAYAR